MSQLEVINRYYEINDFIFKLLSDDGESINRERLLQFMYYSDVLPGQCKFLFTCKEAIIKSIAQLERKLDKKDLEKFLYDTNKWLNENESLSGAWQDGERFTTKLNRFVSEIQSNGNFNEIKKKFRDHERLSRGMRRAIKEDRNPLRATRGYSLEDEDVKKWADEEESPTPSPRSRGDEKESPPSPRTPRLLAPNASETIFGTDNTYQDLADALRPTQDQRNLSELTTTRNEGADAEQCHRDWAVHVATSKIQDLEGALDILLTFYNNAKPDEAINIDMKKLLNSEDEEGRNLINEFWYTYFSPKIQEYLIGTENEWFAFLKKDDGGDNIHIMLVAIYEKLWPIFNNLLKKTRFRDDQQHSEFEYSGFTAFYIAFCFIDSMVDYPEFRRYWAETLVRDSIIAYNSYATAEDFLNAMKTNQSFEISCGGGIIDRSLLSVGEYLSSNSTGIEHNLSETEINNNIENARQDLLANWLNAFVNDNEELAGRVHTEDSEKEKKNFITFVKYKIAKLEEDNNPNDWEQNINNFMNSDGVKLMFGGRKYLRRRLMKKKQKRKSKHTKKNKKKMGKTKQLIKYKKKSTRKKSIKKRKSIKKHLRK